MIKSNRYMTWGLTALVFASLLHLAQRFAHGAGEDYFDFGTGFLYAVAICLLLIWVRTGQRQSRC